MPTRVVLCGVPALEKATSGHVEACEWRIPQQGAAAVHALGLKRRLLVSKEFMAELLRRRETQLDDVRRAAASGQVRGLEALVREPGQDGLRPGSLIVAFEGDGRVGGSLAVAAELSDDALEMCVGSTSDAAALLEELEGQPQLEELLRAPAAAAEPEGDADLPAEDGAEPHAASPHEPDA
ncbi:unnamed protein product [Prorocentrum cordatum]|uniref:Uncharacterized protein n=1 Tax=Prorocentrum cordatum TaxID=2364126 RepID=A0ABN9W0B4_9DINO|nr:unnamed protein product [Polarella glacialis]